MHYPGKARHSRQGGLRPTRRMVKQAIFNVLRDRLSGARVCDLFAGAGALGIEALSAGAASAVFVEQNRKTLRLLRANLEPFADSARVIAGDVLRILPGLSGASFDIILADPPYEQGLGNPTLQLVAQWNLLRCDGVMVFEHSRREMVNAPVGLELDRAHRYGDTVVSIFKRVCV